MRKLTIIIMRLQRILLLIIVLPLTLFLDLILYAATQTCPTCGSFWQWVGSEGALSFPIVVELLKSLKLLKLLKI